MKHIQSGGSVKKKFRAWCVECHADRGYVFKDSIEARCHSCTRSIRSKNFKLNHWKRLGLPSPRVGTSHTPETTCKIAAKQRAYCAEHGNQFLIGKSKGRHTRETIAKISLGNSGKPPRWKGRVFLYEGPNGSINMRSSYELAMARWLDHWGTQWFYEPKFKLKDGRTFSPDFQLPCGLIIETKGYWTARGKDKWEKFCADYPHVAKEALGREELVELGVLKKKER